MLQQHIYAQQCWKKQAEKTAVHIGFVIFAWLPCMETIQEKKGSKTKTHENSKGQFFLNDHAPLHLRPGNVTSCSTSPSEFPHGISSVPLEISSPQPLLFGFFSGIAQCSSWACR